MVGDGRVRRGAHYAAEKDGWQWLDIAWLGYP